MTIFTVFLPHAYAWALFGISTSILCPFIAPPVSPAIATPYPSTHTLDPNGITDGSTAINFIFGFSLMLWPMRVILPADSWLYAVEVTYISVPVCPVCPVGAGVGVATGAGVLAAAID